MSSTAGRHHFLAWSRRGLAAVLGNPDYGGDLPGRGVLQIDLAVAAQGRTPTTQPVPSVLVETQGPGDVGGFEARHVVRTEPREFTANFEPNYLAAIELDEPDLPWLHTPAAPAGSRLRPWIVLIVLKDHEFIAAPGPLPAIDVGSIAALQPLEDSWQWAHTQVSGESGLAGTLAAAPGSVFSRLVCPRRLDPETGYTAFLVPAFEAGRLAGLDPHTPSPKVIPPTGPAWTATTPAPLRLPVFYRFQFHTSDQGDFESLVRRLVPRKFGSDVGQRPMAVDTPAADFPGAGPPVALQGALQSLAVTPTEWQDPDKATFQAALQDLVNRTSPLVDDPTQPDPEVVPPIYGRWHAGLATVSPAGTGWLDGLNMDPRNRTQAGLGTQVVQANLTGLLASAWQQVAGVELANALLRRAQFARAVSTSLYTQRFTAASQSKLLTLTAPLHARMLASPRTLRASIAASRVPPNLFSAPLRRIASAASAVRRRQKRAGVPIGSLVERVNANTVAIVPPPKEPAGLVAIEDVSQKIAPPWQHFFPVVIRVDTPAGDFKVTVELQRSVADGAISIAALQADAITALPPRPDFVVTAPGSPRIAAGGGSGDSPDAVAFRTALLPWTTALQAAEPDAPLAPALDLSAMRATVLARIDPAVTVPARLASRITLGAALNWNPPDPIQPIMAAPSFPQPLYAKLRDIAPVYILPGVDKIPPDTVGLLESNHAFIEAFMVGANHEMARHLLWVGYPTDCRSSYFRQFWDVSRYVRRGSDPTDPKALAELLKDIPPIHTWPLGAPLGQHENRTDVVANNVVLLIRGELLRRYPDAIIYAAKAQVVGRHRVIDPSDERYPIYGGTLPSDITFIGFNLSPQDAKGGTSPSPHGFFFVFQQHPTGPRFGLEPSSDSVASWAQLAWTNFALPGPRLAVGTTALATRSFAGPWSAQRLASQMMSSALASAKLPDFLSASLAPHGVAIGGGEDSQFAWGVDAAQTAAILLRLPFRIAIHADLMVPS